jgi:hypothetical protein
MRRNEENLKGFFIFFVLSRFGVLGSVVYRRRKFVEMMIIGR